MFTLSLREEEAAQFGQLQLTQYPAFAEGAALPSQVHITGRVMPERARVEAFIRSVYREAYDAQIDVRYPTLMSITDAQGNILAAMGLRDAGRERLFLEQYLDAPIEQCLPQIAGEPVARAQIVEVGNLASTGAGAAKFLYLAFHAYAFELGYRYVTVTATSFLSRTFRQMGLQIHPLGMADPDRLPDKGGVWGRYYAARPQVIAGDVAQSLEILLDRYGAKYLPHNTPLRVTLHEGKPAGHA